MKTNSLRALALSLAVTLLGNSALADDGPIQCVAANGQSFGFQLNGAPADYQSGTYPGFATGLHGENVAIRPLPVAILVTPILTRTIVGLNYRLVLPGGTAVSVTHITYAPPSFEDQLGFSGHAMAPSGQTLEVSCL